MTPAPMAAEFAMNLAPTESASGDAHGGSRPAVH